MPTPTPGSRVLLQRVNRREFLRRAGWSSMGATAVLAAPGPGQVLVATAAAQGGSTLGPKDGAGLPPTDLARVAVGSLPPDFTLESRDGTVVTLSSYRGRKNVVLVFYRGHW